MRNRRASTSTQPTIKAVAVAADVSVATVSRALQNPDVVAPETLERVLKAIASLGYTPNSQARNLRTARTRLVIALVPDISNPFFSEIIRGIERVAAENRYSVLLGDTEYVEAREATYAEMIAARQADGLITLMPRIPKLQRPGRPPVVNACEYVSDPNVTSVYIDNVSAARTATEYLLALGHRSIGLIKGFQRSQVSEDRELGYKQALTAAGEKFNRRLVFVGDYSVESGIRATEYLLAQEKHLTALFCCNDEMAIGAIGAIKAKGLRVPQDISVIGFDDIHVAKYYDPPLTTITQPMNEIGAEAMRLLLEMLDDNEVPARKRILSAHLVVRGSAAKRGPDRK